MVMRIIKHIRTRVLGDSVGRRPPIDTFHIVVCQTNPPPVPGTLCIKCKYKCVLKHGGSDPASYGQLNVVMRSENCFLLKQRCVNV